MSILRSRNMSVLLVLLFLLCGSTPLLAANETHHGPSELVFVAQLMLLLLVGRLIGEAMLRIGQPAVTGQLIAGLVLGPSVLGLIWPEAQHFIFPADKDQKAMLDAISQFGILVLLLLTGMETDLKLVRESGKASIAASLAGIILPFLCGVALGEFLPDSMLPDPSKRLITSLFLGTALSIASVKIVATIIREMNFMRRTVGQVILASAIIDDTVGWMITAVIFGLALQDHLDALTLAKSIIGTLVFMAASLTIGRRLVFFIIRWVNDNFVSDFAVITAILLIMGIMAMITDLIGVHTVLGAFVAGILIGESPILTRHIEEELRGLITAFFMPVFFGTAGLTANLTILQNMDLLLLTIGLIAIASFGKFGGAFIGGKLAGLTQRESLALGCGMNARGSTEVIVATIGLSMGALSQNLYTMIVTMAVATTMAMPPTLRWALNRLPLRKEEKQRLEREEMEARGFLPNLERLLLAVDESNNAKFASRIAGMVAGNNAMPTTIIHIKTNKSKKAGRTSDEKEKEKALEAAETVKAFAEPPEREKPDENENVKLDVTTIVANSPRQDKIAEEAEKGYDLLIIGLAKTVTHRNEFHEDLTKLASEFAGPLAVVDARQTHRDDPLKSKLSILVPVNGTEPSRRAAETAIALARASKTSLTALHVATRATKDKKRSRKYDEAILKDIVKLADTYQIEIHTAVRNNVEPDEAILKEAARRKHNFIVMGVARRPGDKLFFGDTAAAILEKAESSILFVAT